MESGSADACKNATLRMMAKYVFSRYQALPLLEAHGEGAQGLAPLREAETSLDLGISLCAIGLTPQAVVLPDGSTLAWDVVEEIAESESACFVIEDGEARKVQAFSEETGRAYGLWATEGAPTMLVAGIPMHRIKGTDPLADTRSKVASVAPVRGRLLDTCTGLGYTAIEAAKTADEVVTIELDPTALEIARVNPWSRGVFESPKIRQIIGDTFEVVPTLEGESFDVVIHDPPMFSLAGELYSLAFYRELWGVLKPRGRLFHYVGDPESKMSGNVTRGVVRRLEEAGFRGIMRRPEAFGVTAIR